MNAKQRNTIHTIITIYQEYFTFNPNGNSIQTLQEKVKELLTKYGDNDNYGYSFLLYESSIFNQENKFYEKILNELMIILSIAKDIEEESLIHIKEEYCYILFIVEVFSKNLNEEYYFKEPSIKLSFISINNILYNSLQNKTIDIQESEILFEAMRTPINYLSHYVLRTNYKEFDSIPSICEQIRNAGYNEIIQDALRVLKEVDGQIRVINNIDDKMDEETKALFLNLQLNEIKGGEQCFISYIPSIKNSLLRLKLSNIETMIEDFEKQKTKGIQGYYNLLKYRSFLGKFSANLISLDKIESDYKAFLVKYFSPSYDYPKSAKQFIFAYEKVSSIINELCHLNDFTLNISDIICEEEFRTVYKKIIKESTVINSYFTKESNNFVHFQTNLNNIDLFFKEHIHPIYLPHGIKGITNRAMQIFINQQDWKIQPDIDLETKKILLRALALLTLIHETPHYIKIFSKVNNPIDENNENEGGKLLFKDLFGISEIPTISEKQAILLLNFNTWNNAKTLKELFIDNRNDKSVTISFMISKKNRCMCLRTD